MKLSINPKFTYYPEKGFEMAILLCVYVDSLLQEPANKCVQVLYRHNKILHWFKYGCSQPKLQVIMFNTLFEMLDKLARHYLYGTFLLLFLLFVNVFEMVDT